MKLPIVATEIGDAKRWVSDDENIVGALLELGLDGAHSCTLVRTLSTEY